MAEEPLEPVGPPPEETQNRTFVLIALGLGGLFIVGLIFIALFAFVIAPGQRKARNAAATGISAANATVAHAITATYLAFTPAGAGTVVAAVTQAGPAATSTPLIPPTVTNTLPPTNTSAPTPTSPPGVAGAATNTPQPLKTRTPTPSAVGGARTPTRVPTATALPATGFADDVGAPGLLLLGLGLIAVLFIARRLRLSRT